MDISSALATITAIGELTKAIINGKIDNEVKAPNKRAWDSFLNDIKC